VIENFRAAARRECGGDCKNPTKMVLQDAGRTSTFAVEKNSNKL
jgi:hypothetical protein